MIQIERKISMSEGEGSVKALTGLYLIRIATKISMTPEVARTAVVNHLKGEVEAKFTNATTHGQASRKEALLKDLDVLGRLPIIYHTVKNFRGEYGSVEYHQMVLNLTEAEQEEASKRITYLSKIANDLSDYLYNIYGEGWSLAHCPISDFVYTLSESRFNGRHRTLMVKNRDESLNKFIDIEYTPKNHIALSYDTNIDKSYNRGSIMKVICSVHDSLDEAFLNRKITTVGIDQGDGLFGRFSFAVPKSDYHNGSIKIETIYKDKPKLVWYKDTAVFYDGEKSFKNIEGYLETWNKRGIKQIDLLQFSCHKDFFFQDSIGQQFLNNKMVLIFLNKDKIDLPRSSFNSRNGRGFSGTISYIPEKNHKRIYVDVVMGNRTPNQGPYFGTVVIPVNKEGIQVSAIDDLNGMIAKILPLSVPEMDNAYNMVDFDTYFNSFKNLLFGLGTSEPDTLSEWFKYCTRTSRQNDDNIVKAYEKMKKSLELEYKEVGAYLNHYDFSKCLPVPKVATDNKILENYYKSLHIEPKTVIINTINNKNIKSIQEIQPTVTFMFVDKNKQIYKNDYSINKFYDSKTNVIELIYDRLKGEVIRDKVKNRR